MSAATGVERSDHARVERLLGQWAQWQHGIMGVGLGYHGSRYSDPEERPGAPVPYGDAVFDRLMLAVERAIGSMPGSLQGVIRAQYLLDDSWTMKSRAKRCHVSMDTYHRRLAIAHAYIAECLGY